MSNISTQQGNNEVFQKSFTAIENTTSSFHHSLSVVLPAYNEEQVIASTLNNVLTMLSEQISDFEVIVVNLR